MPAWFVDHPKLAEPHCYKATGLGDSVVDGVRPKLDDCFVSCNDKSGMWHLTNMTCKPVVMKCKQEKRPRIRFNQSLPSGSLCLD